MEKVMKNSCTENSSVWFNSPVIEPNIVPEARCETYYMGEPQNISYGPVQNCSEFDINEEYFVPTTVEDTAYAIYLSLLVCGLFSNGLVCIVMVRGKRLLKNFSTFHLFNLALTEIIFRLIISPFVLYMEPEKNNSASCKVLTFLDFSSLAVTFTLLAGIAYDRYLNISRPLRSRRITWQHSGRTVLVSWVYAMVCSSPFLFTRQHGNPYQDTFIESEDDFEITFEQNNSEHTTNADESYKMCYFKSGILLKISATIYLVCGFLLPLMIIVLTYSAVLRVLTRRTRLAAIANVHVSQSKAKALKMMGVILLVYILSWGPTLVLLQLDAYGILDNPETEGSTTALFLSDVISFLFSSTSSIANPVIFAYYSRNFRRELKALFCKSICLRMCRCVERNKLMIRETTITASFTRTTRRIIRPLSVSETYVINGHGALE